MPDLGKMCYGPRTRATSHAANIDIRDISLNSFGRRGCMNRFNEIKQFDFVHDVTVNLLTNSAILVYAGPRENIEMLMRALKSPSSFFGCKHGVSSVVGHDSAVATDTLARSFFNRQLCFVYERRT
jgi:hypothetical protein